MTKKEKNNVKGFKKQIERLVTPIFNRVLQEKNSNSMTTIKDYEIPLKILWRAHNYRRKLRVKTKDHKVIRHILNTIEPTEEKRIITEVDTSHYYKEARKIMERCINRKLKPDEVVHHKDRNPTNNRLANLQLLKKGKHASLHHKGKKYHKDKKVKICIKVPRINFNEHTKLISIHNYKGITIQYGKRTLTGIYTQDKIYGEKQTYLIEADTLKNLEKRITQKKEQIRKKIDDALISFSRQFKINLPFEKIIWDRYENWIKGEEFIDKIPKEVIIHDTYFKKVYPVGIEFKNTGKRDEDPVVSMKNYISNRAIEKIAPKIAQNIANLTHRQTSLAKTMKSTFNEFKSLNQANLTQTTKIVGFMKTFGVAMEQHLTLINALKEVAMSMNRSINEMRELRKPFFMRWFGRKNARN